MGKAWWQSKTIWFNVLSLLAAVLTQVEEFVGTLPEGTIPDGATEVIVGIMAVVNVVLRALTKEPVKLTDPKKPR